MGGRQEGEYDPAILGFLQDAGVQKRMNVAMNRFRVTSPPACRLTNGH